MSFYLILYCWQQNFLKEKRNSGIITAWLQWVMRFFKLFLKLVFSSTFSFAWLVCFDAQVLLTFKSDNKIEISAFLIQVKAHLFELGAVVKRVQMLWNVSGVLSYPGHMLDDQMCDRKKKFPAFKKMHLSQSLWSWNLLKNLLLRTISLLSGDASFRLQ